MLISISTSRNTLLCDFISCLSGLSISCASLFLQELGFVLQGAQINEAACDLAREVANEGDALVAGGVSQTPSYLSCKSEKDVKAIFKKQLDVFIKKNVDFLIAEVDLFKHRTAECTPLSVSIFCWMLSADVSVCSTLSMLKRPCGLWRC